MMKQAARFGLAGVLCVLLLPVAAPAQNELREVSGEVVDQHHEPLAGAVVYLENEETQAVQTFLTDRSGHYHFRRVRGDTDYRLWAQYRGAFTKKHFLSKFESGTQKTVVLRLQLR